MTTELVPYQTIPADVEAPAPARPRILLLGTILASVGAAMGFLGLIGHYVNTRAEVIATGEIWLPEGVVIPLTQPNFMGLTTAWSVVSVWWFVQAVRNDDRGNALLASLTTTVFGVGIIAQTAYLFTIMGIQIRADERSVLLYAVIGTHMVLLIAAILFLLVMTFRTLGGGYSSRDDEGPLSAATFWTVVSALYGVMWYVIYITK
jgi:cytochrome c oxidase subunit 3